MGWWKNALGQLDGNGRKFAIDGSIIEEGWFKENKLEGPFREETSKCKFWELKEEYFVPYGDNLNTSK